MKMWRGFEGIEVDAVTGGESIPLLVQLPVRRGIDTFVQILPPSVVQ